MSHMRTCTLDITKVEPSILQDALSYVANEFGLEQVTEIRDYNGYKIKVDLGVAGASHTRGIGIKVGAKGIELVGDDYGQALTMDKFKTHLLQTYRAKVYQRALAQTGHQSQMIRKGTHVQLRTL